jgi:polyisoprenoid-binding protein YceI
MKKRIVTGTAIIILAATFLAFKLHTDTYKVDPKQSKLEWKAAKLTGKHNGDIQVSSGEISNAHGTIAGWVEVDMTSIRNLDVESPEYKAKLENHLKSADFFDVAKYPKSRFVISSVTPITEKKEGGYTHHIKGLLTIKDKTNEIGFDAIINMVGTRASCVGTVTIDRSKFDVKYGSKTFFSDIGDKIIYDDFTLQFNVVADK